MIQSVVMTESTKYSALYVLRHSQPVEGPDRRALSSLKDIGFEVTQTDYLHAGELLSSGNKTRHNVIVFGSYVAHPDVDSLLEIVDRRRIKDSVIVSVDPYISKDRRNLIGDFIVTRGADDALGPLLKTFIDFRRQANSPYVNPGAGRCIG